MKFSLSLVAATAAIAASGVAAFPSYGAAEVVAKAQQEPEKYALFLQKVKEIKEGKVEKRAGKVDGKDGYRDIQALLNPNNFDYNEEQQRVSSTAASGLEKYFQRSLCSFSSSLRACTDPLFFLPFRFLLSSG